MAEEKEASVESIEISPRSTPRRRASRVFVATLGFFLLTHGGHFYSIDNYTVYQTAQALSSGGLAIKPGLATARGRGGKHYGVYGIGLSLLELPFIWTGSIADKAFPFEAIVGDNISIFYPENFSVFAASLVSPLFGALAAASFWLIAELLGYPLKVVAWLTIILVASTQFWPAARDSFPHIVVACLLLMAVRDAITWRDARFKARPIMLGSIAGLLILVRAFDALLSLPLLSIYLLWRDWQRVWTERRFLNSNFGRFLIVPAICIVMVGLINTARFENPLAFNESVGFDGPLLTGLFGLLLSVRRGVIFFSPPVVATLPGLIMLGRRRPAEGLLVAALIAVYPLGYAKYPEWHGSLCWGPRYIVPALPFAVLPLGELLMMGGVAEALVLALGVVGVMVQLIGTLVDFQRAAFFTEPSYSQIAGQWRDLIAGSYLDWLPIRLYAAHGFVTAVAYAEWPLAMATWASISLRKLVRSANGAGATDA